MAETETPKESGALSLLRDAINRGSRIAVRPDVQPGTVKMWSVSVRAPLRKAFGGESPILTLWPTHETPVPPLLARETLRTRVSQLQTLVSAVEAAAADALAPTSEKRVFIGHGRSPLWRELKDFLEDRLGLQWDEFNREAVAGISTTERLNEMLGNANFAFLIMTAEDEYADATVHARQNVVHEVGLFQGRLGLRKGIILMEEGCHEFSNIHGLSYIPFPSGRIYAAFEEIRRVLERESIIGI